MSGSGGWPEPPSTLGKASLSLQGSGREVAPPRGGAQPPGRGWGSAAGQPRGLSGHSCGKLHSGGGCARQRPGGRNVNEGSVTELVRYTDPGDPAGGGTAGLRAGKALRDPKASAGPPRPQQDPQSLSGTPRPQRDPKALQDPKASAGPQGFSGTLSCLWGQLIICR